MNIESFIGFIASLIAAVLFLGGLFAGDRVKSQPISKKAVVPIMHELRHQSVQLDEIVMQRKRVRQMIRSIKNDRRVVKGCGPVCGERLGRDPGHQAGD